MINQDHHEAEFDKFLDLITHFCTELTSGISPEYALARSISYFGEHCTDIQLRTLKAIVEGAKSFSSAWDTLIQSYQDSKYQRILELLGSYIEKGSQIGGTRMLKVLNHVRKNHTLVKNRNSIVKAQRGKVLGLAMVSSAVLGMVGGIAPMISNVYSDFLLINQLNEFPLSLTLQVFIILFLSVNVSAYRLTQLVGKSSQVLMLCSFSFIASFVFTINLIFAVL